MSTNEKRAASLDAVHAKLSRLSQPAVGITISRLKSILLNPEAYIPEAVADAQSDADVLAATQAKDERIVELEGQLRGQFSPNGALARENEQLRDRLTAQDRVQELLGERAAGLERENARLRDSLQAANYGDVPKGWDTAITRAEQAEARVQELEAKLAAHPDTVRLGRLEEWASLSYADLRLRCGELTAQEIRTIRAVLAAINATPKGTDHA